ncbi:alanine dehydrogenase [Bacilli bacterium PM5-3]|nr:alanine dehydrogenase [Bacilli bacterium PM5-3]MDH6603788.1 alanine dehydrogenase [Bacilli bacterium PM5-9]
MKVGLPKEIKNNESRVGMTPIGVQALANSGHDVIVETNAGINSGISDEEYTAAGATIVESAQEAWDVDMVVKVKEPQESEYQFFKEGMILYTYLHLAPVPSLIKALMDSKVQAVAYETVQLEDGSLPLLAPMSEIAGRRSITLAAQFLEKPHGGQGILLGGAPGTEKGNVVVVGAGVSGLHAAKMALGLGAKVTILDIDLPKLRYVDDVFPQMQTLYSSEQNLASAIKDADAVISTVLIPGSQTPKLIKEYMVKSMKAGSVIIDVAIDQGGSVETIDRVTTHDEPTFEKYGVIHYSVANMPGAVARTSTYALTNATLPYMVKLANKGIRACLENDALLRGLNVIDGKVTYKSVALPNNLYCYDPKEVIENL